MDTRSKILCPSGARDLAARLRSEGRRVRLIAGSFDVLLAAHARALTEAAAPSSALFVAVLDCCDAPLTLQGRAELVAALRRVECVIPMEAGGLRSLTDLLQPDDVLDWVRDDERRFEELAQHVQQRHAR